MYSTVPVALNRKFGYGDVFLLLIFFGFLYYFVSLARQWNGDFHPDVVIDLSMTALPMYSAYSLIRAFVAYGFSLLFTLFFGYLAAKSRAAEKFIIPLLDVGQSIPVLGFMPGLVLGLISIFPNSNFGMELACILLIFTGQVWNMTFAFYASLKSVPPMFYEMGDVIGLSHWDRFKEIEIPAASINLAWNSLMSMAGGWFFLIACESFTLGEKNFRLPGLGSYMSVAIEQGNTMAITAGVIAMGLVIIFTDFLVWRPIISWTRKFRLEETQDDVQDTPFLTLLLRESKLISWAKIFFRAFFRAPLQITTATQGNISAIIFPLERQFLKNEMTKEKWIQLRPKLKTFISAFLFTLSVFLLLWMTIRLWEFVRELRVEDWRTIFIGTSFTFLRIVAALILGSLWAIPFGIWVGLSPKLTRFFQPIIQLAASFPAPMIYPLALGLFLKLNIGLSIGSSFLMLLGVQWYILFNVLAGAINISRELSESFDLIGTPRRDRWLKLYLPSVFPSLLTGWITAAGGAWNASIVSEYVLYNGTSIQTLGLGSLISIATGTGNYPFLVGCLMVMVGVVVAINRIFWRPIQRFAESRYRF